MDSLKERYIAHFSDAELADIANSTYGYIEIEIRTAREVLLERNQKSTIEFVPGDITSHRGQIKKLFFQDKLARPLIVKTLVDSYSFDKEVADAYVTETLAEEVAMQKDADAKIRIDRALFVLWVFVGMDVLMLGSYILDFIPKRPYIDISFVVVSILLAVIFSILAYLTPSKPYTSLILAIVLSSILLAFCLLAGLLLHAIKYGIIIYFAYQAVQSVKYSSYR